MKVCIIWRGLAGSGKSTINDLICGWFAEYAPGIGRSNSETCCADDYWWMATCSLCGDELGRAKLKDYSIGDHIVDAHGGEGRVIVKPVYRFDVHYLQDAHDWNFARFQRACDKGVGLVTVPNVNYALAHYEPYKRYAEACGYQVFVLQVECPAELAAQRQQHGVTLDRIQKQARRYEPVNTPWVLVNLPGPAYRPVCTTCHRVADWCHDADYFYCQKCNQRLGENVGERATMHGDFNC